MSRPATARTPAHPLLIDYRRGRTRPGYTGGHGADLVTPLSALLPDASLAVLCHLDSGDVSITGNGPAGPDGSAATLSIGIEVKSVSDLLSSAASGRLQASQLPAMLDTYDRSYLAVYGEYGVAADGVSLLVKRANGKLGRTTTTNTNPNPWSRHYLGNRRSGTPYGYLESMLLSVSALGVIVKHTPTLPLLCSWLACLYRWWSKPWSAHKLTRTLDNSQSLMSPIEMDPATRLVAKVASALPMIGYERAVALAAHFATPLALVSATPAQLSAVRGIGPILAAEIVRAVRGG